MLQQRTWSLAGVVTILWERTIRMPEPCTRQRPLRIWAYPEEFSWKTTSHHSTLSQYPVLLDIRRVLPDKVAEGDPGWVLQGVLSRACLFSSTTSQQPKKHSQSCLGTSVTVTPRNVASERSSSLRFAWWCLTKRWTCWPVTSTERHQQQD